MTIFGVVAALAFGFTGRITPKEAMDYVMYLIGFYVAGEAFGDGKLLGLGGTTKIDRMLAVLTGIDAVVKKNGNGSGGTAAPGSGGVN